MTSLGVWWEQELVGELEESRSLMTFRYSNGRNSPMISVALPPRTQPHPNKTARPFFQGLLPEGTAREMIAYDLGLGNNGGSDFDLLEAIGRDCAGALVISAEPPHPPAGQPAPLSEAEVGERLRALPTEPLGVGGDVRVSLPGMQPKLLLVLTPDRRWALPSDGFPSTHILKPANPNLPGSVENEVFCQTFAAELGVSAARTALETIDGAPVLVSERFDRERHSDGTVRRLHQEDGCQALSIESAFPANKYQRIDGEGPSLIKLAAIVDLWGDTRDRVRFVDQVVVNAVVGNADFHAKNVTLLHRGHVVQLSPLYDVMSTTALSEALSKNLSLHVGNATSVNAVNAVDIVDEAVAWGLRRDLITEHVNELLCSVHGALDRTCIKVPFNGDRLAASIAQRADRMKARN